jgi:zinc protease
MKKSIILLFLMVFAGIGLMAQIDRSQRPQPGPAPVIRLGDFETFKLKNGLQVIVVENNKVPVVSFQLSLAIDPVLEGDAAGYVSMAGSLMREGTTTRTKQQIDEDVDFIGASLSTFSNGVYASSLKRHTETILELMADVLFNPVFPEAELQRSINQAKSGLESSRNNAGFIAGNIANVTRYGAGHPYGEVTTPESLDNITRDHLVNYYNTYFKPNVAYLVIVGDVNVKEAKKLAKKYFGKWEKGAVPSKTYPTPTAPESTRVALGNRTGATQSSVYVTYPVTFTPGNPDAIKAAVMNNILGGGVFSGRLMQNLREDKGYTYGARSSLRTDRLIGSFTANTEVRNSVTDTTVNEILFEMQRLIDEPITEESLQLVKNYLAGNFSRSLESPRTIASYALNVMRYNLPSDYYANYLANLDAVTVADVQAMAAKYLKPANAIIIVAGSQEEVLEPLRAFSATGDVELYDPFGRPVAAPRKIGSEIAAEDIVNAYVKAVGGAENLKKVDDLTINMKATIQGMQLEAVTVQKSPNMFMQKMTMGGNVLQLQVFDGTAGSQTAMGQTQEITGDELAELKLQAVMFPELQYDQLGYELELMGIEDVNGQEAYRIRFTGPTGKIHNEYFSLDTRLRIKSQRSQESPVGSVSIETFYSDYRPVDGVMFPFVIKQQAGPQSIDMEVLDVEVNSGVDSAVFSVK